MKPDISVLRRKNNFHADDTGILSNEFMTKFYSILKENNNNNNNNILFSPYGLFLGMIPLFGASRGKSQIQISDFFSYPYSYKSLLRKVRDLKLDKISYLNGYWLSKDVSLYKDFVSEFEEELFKVNFEKELEEVKELINNLYYVDTGIKDASDGIEKNTNLFIINCIEIMPFLSSI